MTSFPDIKDIMLYQRYEQFPLFVPVDKQLEWIEQFEPYLSPQRFLRNKVDEFDTLQASLDPYQSETLLRIYQKFLATLNTLSTHKGILLHQIKEEYDQLREDYLRTDNQQQKFVTLADLLNQHNLELRYDTFSSELILIEPSSTILMVPYKNQLCLIKRSYLEHFREEPNEKYIDPISDYCIQELMDIPIDTESILNGLQTHTFSPTLKNYPLESTSKTIVYLIAEQLDIMVVSGPQTLEQSSEILFKPIQCQIDLDLVEEPVTVPISVSTAASSPPAQVTLVHPPLKPTLSTGPRHLSKLRSPMKSSLDLLKQVTQSPSPILSRLPSSKPPTPIISARPPLPPRKPSTIQSSKPPIAPLKPKADPNLLKKRFK